MDARAYSNAHKHSAALGNAYANEHTNQPTLYKQPNRDTASNNYEHAGANSHIYASAHIYA